MNTAAQKTLATPGTPGKGPSGATCGSCRHLFASDSGVVTKCLIAHDAWTLGPETDIARAQPACELYWKTDPYPRGAKPVNDGGECMACAKSIEDVDRHGNAVWLCREVYRIHREFTPALPAEGTCSRFTEL